MSKSNKYGYSGVDIPTQAFKANVGKFDPAEINELVAEDKWTQYGQLELIETQTISSVAQVDFTNLGNYNVHFFTFNNFHFGADNKDLFSRVLVGGSEQSGASDYGRAFQACADSYFYEDRDPDLHSLRHIPEIGSATYESLQGYIYMYNALDSSKYTFFTQQLTGIKYDGKSLTNFGSGVYQQSNVLSGIRFYTSGSPSSIASADISIYGIKEYS